MDPREFICNVYSHEFQFANLPTDANPWDPVPDGTPGHETEWPPSREQVVHVLDRLVACGFTMVGLNETAGAWDGTGWDFQTLQGLKTKDGTQTTDTIVGLAQARSLKILLRFWAKIPGVAARDRIVARYGPRVLGPVEDGSNPQWNLNPYAVESLELVRDMAVAMKPDVGEGLWHYADWVTVGWTASGEVDDIRKWKGLPQISRPVRYDQTQIVRAPVTSPRTVAGNRQPRIHDAQEAIALLFGQVHAVLGGDKPIGCMRGSAWHLQDDRRNLPFLDNETYVQTNDANQLSNTDCTGPQQGPPGPFVNPEPGTKVQIEALCFACDILRGSGKPVAVIEADGLQQNMEHMDPPGLPDPDPNEPDIQKAFKERSLISFRRGVSYMLTHVPYNRLGVWQTTLRSIADSSDRTTPPLPEPEAVEMVVTGTYPLNYIPNAVANWRSSPAGSLTVSKPVVIRFAMD